MCTVNRMTPKGIFNMFQCTGDSMIFRMFFFLFLDLIWCICIGCAILTITIFLKIHSAKCCFRPTKIVFSYNDIDMLKCVCCRYMNAYEIEPSNFANVYKTNKTKNNIKLSSSHHQCI